MSNDATGALKIVSSFLPVYTGIAVTGAAIRAVEGLGKDKKKESYYKVKPIPKFRI